MTRAALLPVAALLLTACGRAMVSAPVPPPSPVIGAEETGLASWYGHPYHGRRTASGEVYDMAGLTAAHRTLPFGSQLLVTRLDAAAGSPGAGERPGPLRGRAHSRPVLGRRPGAGRRGPGGHPRPRSPGRPPRDRPAHGGAGGCPPHRITARSCRPGTAGASGRLSDGIAAAGGPSGGIAVSGRQRLRVGPGARAASGRLRPSSRRVHEPGARGDPAPGRTVAWRGGCRGGGHGRRRPDLPGADRPLSGPRGRRGPRRAAGGARLPRRGAAGVPPPEGRGPRRACSSALRASSRSRPASAASPARARSSARQ